MIEEEVRRLFAAEPIDERLGVSTVDVDAVVRRERRTVVRQRAVLSGLAAVVVTAVAITAPSALGGLSGGTGQAPPVGVGGPPVTTPPASALPTSATEEPDQPSSAANEAAAQVLKDHFGLTADEPYPTQGRGASVVGHGTHRGVPVEVSFTIMEGTGNVGKKAECTRESAEYRDVICTDHAQPDGSVVSLRGATTRSMTFTEAILLRGDADILLMVSYGTTDARKLKRYPDAVLIRAVTDDRLIVAK